MSPEQFFCYLERTSQHTKQWENNEFRSILTTLCNIDRAWKPKEREREREINGDESHGDELNGDFNELVKCK